MSEPESLIELLKQNQAILDQQKALAAQLTVLVEQQTRVVKQQLFDRLNRLHGQPLEEHASAPSTEDATITSHSNRKRKAVRWTSEEEQTLVTGVDRCGMNAWDTIRENYEVLSSRSSISLKSKWSGLHNSKRLGTLLRSINARGMNSIGDEGLLASISLDTIADNLFFHIAEYIGEPSLCGVAKMCRELGAVSKKVRQKCHNYMISVPLDINMAEIYTNSRKVYMLPALTWVKERRAKLRSFSVFCNAKEYEIIVSVLQVCNTSEMKELNIRDEHGFWHKNIASHTHIHLPPTLPMDDTPSNLGLSILENAPNLEKFCFHFHASYVSLDFLTKLYDLKVLDFGFSNTNQFDTERMFMELMHRVEYMSNLRRLSLSRGFQAGNLLLKTIRSETLEEIDVINMAKHCWCEGVVCPSLKLFSCLGGYYGNGIRQQLPERSYSYENCQVTGICERSRDFPCQGVQVPDSCIFYIDGGLYS